MRSCRILRVLLIVIGLSAGVGFCSCSSFAQEAPSTPSGAFPPDVFPETGNRLPAVKPEELDETAKKLYDARPGLIFGPEGMRIYSPKAAALFEELNDYTRKDTGLEPRLVWLAILATAREMDAEYVWTTHERDGLKAGLTPEIIDIVKHRKPVKGVGEKEAAIIDLVREAMGKHQVSSETTAHALKLFGKTGLVNIVFIMGDYASIGIFANVFGQQVRPPDKPLLPIP